MKGKTTTTWELTPEQLLKFLVDQEIVQDGSKLSFKTKQQIIESKYDDWRDPPSYKTVIEKIIITHKS